MVRATYAPHHADMMRISYASILQDCLGLNHIMAMDAVLMPAHIFYLMHSVLACSEGLLNVVVCRLLSKRIWIAALCSCAGSSTAQHSTMCVPVLPTTVCLCV